MSLEAHDNPFPSILNVEGTTPADLPAAGQQRLFIRSSDHVLCYVNSAGTVTPVGASSGMTDPMTTRGDMIIRNASNATARLGRGSAGQVLTSDGTDLAWQTPSAGGAAITYPALKPSPPTYDFASTNISSFTAHSNTGSFATSDCIEGGVDGSKLEMQYSNQGGTLYVTHGNTDLDFSVGGLKTHMNILGGVSSLQYVIGIAALNSSGSGQCVMLFNDGNCYFAPVVTYAQSGILDTWSNYGLSQYANGQGEWWLRLKRVGSTWTAYASISGKTWDKTFATDTTAYTVAQLHVGILRTTAAYARISLDYFHVAV